MNYLELFDKMNQCTMVSNDWRHLISFLYDEIENEPDRDTYVKLFVMYLSLVEDGNVYMPLEQNQLKELLNEKINGLKARIAENKTENVKQIKTEKENALDTVEEEMKSAFNKLTSLAGLSVIGDKKFFLIDNNRLFMRRYFNAKNLIKESAQCLFVNNAPTVSTFDYKSSCKDGFSLSKGQERVLNKGTYNNLLVTGGPGTGKTTSILFILLGLLQDDPNRPVYLTAPSGKAAARMKESILNCLDLVTDKYKKDNYGIIGIIENLESYTIHRLLGLDGDTKGFIKNKNNPFDDNSIFVIDEASMIDICLFASLLDAIPKKARVFILGDKNQLPSVGCGAVFGEWLGAISSSNKEELTESQRFSNESAVYMLSEAINKGATLPVQATDWCSLTSCVFEIKKPEHDARNKRINHIYYYDGVTDVKSDHIDDVVKKWHDQFYKDFPNECKELDASAAKESDAKLDKIFRKTEAARILCADNDSIRGVEHINRCILKKCFKGQLQAENYYIGELLMVTKNNHKLDLYNGDSGVVVTFKDDDTAYCMFKKMPEKLILNEGYNKNNIFKVGSFMFYPLRLISRDEIKPAFAMTIHKSQGSDYSDILIILPKKAGHPLLNRQIVYTAITRTKGDVYILADQDNLEQAKNKSIKRNTGVFE